MAEATWVSLMTWLQADRRRAVLRWQRAAQHGDTLWAAAGRAVQTGTSGGPRCSINLDVGNFLGNLLVWRVSGKSGRHGAAAGSNGADGDADDSSAVVNREKAD